ncbi:MAG: MBL fold metallo-hydrolase [Woeseiaceae bacterium]
MKRCLISMGFLALGLQVQAHEYVTFEELGAAFGYDLENKQIVTETVAPGIHVLFGVGGNIVVSIGDQGVLMVDSQFPEMIPRISRAIENLGGDGIDFTVNTHWHFDHASGNPPLGRDGAWMVSQANSRRMMAGEHEIDLVSLAYLQPAFSDEAMPVITFTDEMQFHFNGHTIDLMHYGPAHTTGDAAVLFRESNVVHMGDVFNAAGYPFIDAGNGGDLNGMIHFCKKVLARLDEDSVVVPGHGMVAGYNDLAAYVAMLETVRNRINGMIDAGMSLEDVLNASPTADFDEKFGNPARFIDRSYKSLSR